MNMINQGFHHLFLFIYFSQGFFNNLSYLLYYHLNIYFFFYYTHKSFSTYTFCTKSYIKIISIYDYTNIRLDISIFDKVVDNKAFFIIKSSRLSASIIKSFGCILSLTIAYTKSTYCKNSS